MRNHQNVSSQLRADSFSLKLMLEIKLNAEEMETEMNEEYAEEKREGNVCHKDNFCLLGRAFSDT